MSIRISFDVPNLMEAEFVLSAVRAKLDELRAKQAEAPPEQVAVTAAGTVVEPVATQATPPKSPGRPRKAGKPADPDPVPEVEPVAAPVTAPVATPAPTNIFDAPPADAPAPVAAPTSSGASPKDLMNKLYAYVADTKGAGEAIKVTMALLKQFGVARVVDVPQDKWGAFESEVNKLMV